MEFRRISSELAQHFAAISPYLSSLAAILPSLTPISPLLAPLAIVGAPSAPQQAIVSRGTVEFRGLAPRKCAVAAGLKVRNALFALLGRTFSVLLRRFTPQSAMFHVEQLNFDCPSRRGFSVLLRRFTLQGTMFHVEHIVLRGYFRRRKTNK